MGSKCEFERMVPHESMPPSERVDVYALERCAFRERRSRFLLLTGRSGKRQPGSDSSDIGISLNVRCYNLSAIGKARAARFVLPRHRLTGMFLAVRSSDPAGASGDEDSA